MAEEIKMPQLGLTMTEGTLGKWRKQVGDQVAVGDVLVEVMTDKITSELEATAAGVLRVIAAQQGDVVPVQGLLAIIGGADEQLETGVVEAKAQDAVQEVDAALNVSPRQKTSAQLVDAGGRLRVSPLAKKIAVQMGIDLSTIAGTGPGGRIIKADIDAACARKQADGGQLNAQSSPPLAAQGVPLSGMRKIIAERMTLSKHTAPHVTIMTEVNVDATVALRSALNSRSEGVRFTYTDLIVKMTACALRRFPDINASLIDDHIIQHDDIHIGVAVALDNGLMVPVVRHADRLGLQQIHQICKANADRARAGTLPVEALGGGTFTISNLGGYEIDGFTPVINQPEAAILGVGRIIKKPAVIHDEIIIAAMMTLSLSFDHRLTDGAQAAQFLRYIKHCLEDSTAMLL